VQERVRNTQQQLLDLTDDEIEHALGALDESDGVSPPISGPRPIATTVSQLSWELTELRRLLRDVDTAFAAKHGSSGVADPFDVVAAREKLRTDWRALVQTQLDRADRALRELHSLESINPRLERDLSMSIALLRRELENAW